MGPIRVELIDAEELRERLTGIADAGIHMLPAGVVDGEDSETIGVLSWTNGSRTELARASSLRSGRSGPLVAVLSQQPSVRAARVLSVLLDGAVLLPDLVVAWIPTLVAVAAGQCVTPRRLREMLDRPALSPRERQVLAMVVLDFSNAEIAHKLCVTESNVKNHLTSAFNKLGVQSRTAATQLILDPDNGLGPGILRILPTDDDGL